MTLEIEQKFRVTDRHALREQILALGGQFSEPVTQSDAYFDHPLRDFDKTDEALRIRSTGDENVITYKGPKQQHAVKTRREIELPLASGKQGAANFTELLTLLGFEPVATVTKQREQATVHWQGRETNIALDSAHGIGEFCEIELCVDDAEMSAAQAHVQALAAQLGLKDIERRSYLGMKLAHESP